MRFKFLSFLLITGFYSNHQAQILTDSNLPIVIINSNGNTIVDEPKVEVGFQIIDNGFGLPNNINDAPNIYNGYCGIEWRGNSTQGFDKKTYSLELHTSLGVDTSASLLGMGVEEDWILHAMVIDKSQLRIPMSFYLSQQMGHYAPNWRYVEVVLDGDYRGVYILVEKIKRDNDRVDIAKLDEDDLAGDSLTGGYILRIDWLDDAQGFESNYNSQGGIPMFYQWYYPKASKIKPQQAAYIQEWMGAFEEALYASNYTNSQGKRYTDLINVNSFTDFLIINELSKNSDGYKLSSYVHKDKFSKGGKLVAGPIWDFDQTYGVSEVCSNNDFTGWTYLQNQNGCEDLESMPMWWQTMMADDVFKNRLKCRWELLRQGVLHKDAIDIWIDADTTDISDAIARNFTKWDDFIGQSIWIEPSPIPQSYAEEISTMKDWISNRVDWMDANLLGDCSQDTPVSISENSSDALEIFPNPAKDLVWVNSEGFCKLKIYSIQGKLIESHSVLPGINSISILRFPAGYYLFTFLSDIGKQSTSSIVVE
jgi:hypothetical protein